MRQEMAKYKEELNGGLGLSPPPHSWSCITPPAARTPLWRELLRTQPKAPAQKCLHRRTSKGGVKCSGEKVPGFPEISKWFCEP